MSKGKAQAAFKEIAASHPQQAQAIQAYIRDLLNEKVVALGTDQAFALRDENGRIQAYKQRVHLSAQDGTLVQPVPGGPYVISAQGYEVLNEATGTCVVLPGQVLVDGQWQQNPHVVRDPHNRRILAIYARAVAFRFSSKGLPQVSDWSTIFDTPSYRLIDLLGKARKYPQAFKLLPEDMSPENGDQATWAKYPFDESTNLWVNTTHQEALQWFATILNREKKAIDFAQTFAKRNASKHLHGLQKAPGPQWDVEVYCWKPENGQIVKWDTTQYQNLKNSVEGLTSDGGAKFALGNGQGTTIDLKQGATRVSDEEEEMAMESQVDPEDQPEEMQAQAPEPTPEPEPAPEPEEAPAPELSPEEQNVMNQLQETQQQFPEEFDQACWDLNIAGDYTPEQAKQIMERINSLLDAG
ncbi:MAG: hypothetical protein ACOCQT_00170 [Desulfovermiculus sp.]